MEERFRNQYFILLRIALLLALEVYIILSCAVLTGASVKVLLLLALFIGVTAGKELTERRYQVIWLSTAGVIWMIMILSLGTGFTLLGVYLCYEVLTYFKPRLFWYILPVGIAFIPGETDGAVQVMMAALIGLIYCQHDLVVEPYRKQAKEDTIAEQRLKHDINRREHKMQEEVRKSFLMAENQMLEERAELSQTLHDKLGHSINGSVYQLEAVKVLLEKEPEVSKKMVRCSISDNGIGCKEIIDGMGISGIRKRMREVNGILDFETEAGFTINMLLPL